MNIAMSVARTLTGLLILALTSQSLAGSLEIERFTKEYPVAVRLLEARLARIKGECRLTRRDAGKPERSTTAQFATDYNRHKLEIVIKQPPKNAETQLILCIHEDAKRSFSLSRPAQAETFRIEGVGSPMLRETYMSLFGDFLAAPYSVACRPMSQIMAESTFRVHSARALSIEGRDCIEVVYETGDSAPKSSATVVFDPGAGWVIRRSDSRPGDLDEIPVFTKVDYELGVSNSPMPRTGSIGNKLLTLGCEFKNVAFESTPEGEFAMQFYKLPDLATGATPTRSFTLFWIGGAGAAGLLIAYGLKRLSMVRPGPVAS